MYSGRISTRIVIPATGNVTVFDTTFHIKFFSDLQRVSGFLLIIRFPSQINGHNYIIEILLKVVLNTHRIKTYILQIFSILVHQISQIMIQPQGSH